MHVILNKIASIAYERNAYITLLEEGYALPIETRDNATVLLFKDVEDHVDGNGLSILWMLDGDGTFFYDGHAVALKKGDALVFDDNIEHGFESTDYCIAVNICIDLKQDCNSAFINDTLDAFIEAHNNLKFSSVAPNF